MGSTNTTEARISDEQFAHLKDLFAFQGRRLYRSDPADGRILYFIERLGLVELADLDNALATLKALEARR